jgi:hypothetical protein
MSDSKAHVHSVTIKILNWRYYSNTTNAIYWEWTGLVSENVNLYNLNVSPCLVDAYEDYSCFGEVSFFIVSEISEWNKEQWLSFVWN